MDSASATKELVLRYFSFWPRQRYDEMRTCLADEVEFDAGGGSVVMDADAFTRQAAEGAPWRKVRLIRSLFDSEHAALLYEGVDTGTDARMRVGEFVTVSYGKIRRIEAAIVHLDMRGSR